MADAALIVSSPSGQHREVKIHKDRCSLGDLAVSIELLEATARRILNEEGRRGDYQIGDFHYNDQHYGAADAVFAIEFAGDQPAVTFHGRMISAYALLAAATFLRSEQIGQAIEGAMANVAVRAQAQREGMELARGILRPGNGGPRI